MNDTDDLVVDMSWNALNAVTKVSKYNRGSVLYIFLVLDIVFSPTNVLLN